MNLRFDETKATQTAAYLLKMRGGRIHYFKLIKLLYLSDRLALSRLGKPITTDRYVSMNHGPVVSEIYNLIIEDKPKPVWSRFISAPFGDYEVKLLDGDPPSDTLSRAEEKVLCEVFQEYGHRDRWKLEKYVHTLPEYRFPHGSSIPITLEEILVAIGQDQDEINATIAELKAMELVDTNLTYFS